MKKTLSLFFTLMAWLLLQKIEEDLADVKDSSAEAMIRSIKELQALE